MRTLERLLFRAAPNSLNNCKSFRTAEPAFLLRPSPVRIVPERLQRALRVFRQRDPDRRQSGRPTVVELGP